MITQKNGPHHIVCMTDKMDHKSEARPTVTVQKVNREKHLLEIPVA